MSARRFLVYHEYWYNPNKDEVRFICKRNNCHVWSEPAYRVQGKEVFRYCPECGDYSKCKDVNEYTREHNEIAKS